MQKLKSNVINKLLEANATSTEINLLLYISHYQFDRGNAMGIYYREACKEIGASYQAFYDALRGLEGKGIIAIEKGNFYDWDVLILDNNFCTEDANKESYISTSYHMFQSKSFYALKAKEKLMALYIYKLIGANKGKYRINCSKLMKLFMDSFKVGKRAIQSYMRKLRGLFYINLSQGLYWFSLKKVKGNSNTTDKHLVSLNIARSVCRRNRAEYNKKTFNNVVSLIKQYYKDYSKKLQKCFSVAFEKSIYQRNECIANKYKWNRKISPAYIHKILRQELGIEAA